jgi:hypothetical protein
MTPGAKTASFKVFGDSKKLILYRIPQLCLLVGDMLEEIFRHPASKFWRRFIGSSASQRRAMSKNIAGKPYKKPPSNAELRGVVIPENAASISSGYVRVVELK